MVRTTKFLTGGSDAINEGVDNSTRPEVTLDTIENLMGERSLRNPSPTTALPFPASGAWKVGDPVADRKFCVVGGGVGRRRPFALEGGGRLEEVTICYETWGKLNAEASNALLICHALTGDAHAAGKTMPGQLTPGWWDAVIGPGKAVDTDKFFVVCSNVLGGCQGTTGPSSPHPDDGKPYGSRFPIITVRDMVRVQNLLATELGVDRWHSVIGGSMGGRVALEYAIMFPEKVGSTALLCASVAASPAQIGWSRVGRLAIVQDPKWAGGDYYHAARNEGPHEGLMLARRIAQLNYRCDSSYQERFGRATVEATEQFDLWGRYQVESYLDYHGLKLARRFDANSYLVLNKAMDLFDVGRGRGGVAAAVARIRCPVSVVSIDSDGLYPPRQQRELRDALARAGVDVSFEPVSSPHGHDGFLIEDKKMSPLLTAFLDNSRE